MAIGNISTLATFTPPDGLVRLVHDDLVLACGHIGVAFHGNIIPFLPLSRPPQKPVIGIRSAVRGYVFEHEDRKVARKRCALPQRVPRFGRTIASAHSLDLGRQECAVMIVPP